MKRMFAPLLAVLFFGAQGVIAQDVPPVSSEASAVEAIDSDLPSTLEEYFAQAALAAAGGTKGTVGMFCIDPKEEETPEDGEQPEEGQDEDGMSRGDEDAQDEDAQEVQAPQSNNEKYYLWPARDEAWEGFDSCLDRVVEAWEDKGGKVDAAFKEWFVSLYRTWQPLNQNIGTETVFEEETRKYQARVAEWNARDEVLPEATEAATRPKTEVTLSDLVALAGGTKGTVGKFGMYCVDQQSGETLKWNAGEEVSADFRTCFGHVMGRYQRQGRLENEGSPGYEAREAWARQSYSSLTRLGRRLGCHTEMTEFWNEEVPPGEPVEEDESKKDD